MSKPKTEYVERITRVGNSVTCRHTNRKIKARGLCGACYNRHLKLNGKMPVGVCKNCKKRDRHISTTGKICVYCWDCKRRKEGEWRHLNYDRWRKHQKKAQLKRVYGMTPEQFESKLKTQNHKCAICLVDLNTKVKHSATKACIDHNHTTGKVRSILCSLCNITLGGAREDINVLSKCIDYLLEHERD